MDKNKRQPSLHSYKVLPRMSLECEKRERTLSRSKSKAQLSKQASKESVRFKNPINSTLNETVSKKHRGSGEKETQMRVSKLLNKKLTVFMH